MSRTASTLLAAAALAAFAPAGPLAAQDANVLHACLIPGTGTL